MHVHWIDAEVRQKSFQQKGQQNDDNFSDDVKIAKRWQKK